MKILTIFSKIAFIVAVAGTASASNEKKFLETVGVATNFSNGEAVEAVNYALAKSTSGEFLSSKDRTYKDPVIVKELPPKQQMQPSESVLIEDVTNGIGDYYNGSIGLKTTVSFCTQFETKPQACVSNSNCGWCVETNKCVTGKNSGPSDGKECLRGRYLFDAPTPNWNPIVTQPSQVTQLNIMGAPLTVVQTNGLK